MALMEEPPRTTPVWVKALILFVAVLGAAVGTSVWLRSSSQSAWRALQETTRALVAEANARPATRPVLRGTPEPGSAWVDYDLALNNLAGQKNEFNEIIHFILRERKADRAAVDSYLASKAEALDHLRRGSRKAEGAFAYSWNLGLERRIPPVSLANALARLAVAQAMVFHEAGRTREAAEVLLDLMQFGGDIRRNAPLVGDVIGAGLVASALDELKELILSGKLTAAELTDLAGPLEILDRSWADYRTSLRNEAAATLSALGTEDFSFLGDKAVNALRAWRHGFSMKRMAADAGQEILRYTERAIANESLPWVDRLKAHEELKREVDKTSNLLVKLTNPGGGRYGSLERHARAKLRLLRFAIHSMTTGGRLELDDPFGAKLRHREVDGKLRVWSLGRDGVDQDGAGDWRRDLASTDLILEIPK